MTELNERVKVAIGDCMSVMMVSPQWDLNGVIQTLTDLQAALTWVPCEVRNPETSGFYFVAYKKLVDSIPWKDAFYNAEIGEWQTDKEVLAWRERPQPYTPKEAEDE